MFLIQLRFLQTLNGISENSHTIMFPLPLHLMDVMARKKADSFHCCLCEEIEESLESNSDNIQEMEGENIL